MTNPGIKAPIPWDVEKYSRPILDSAYKVHSGLGPGLLESVYETCLAHELLKKGIKTERQVPLPVIYDNIRFDEGFRIDLLVEKKVVVELKVADEILPVHKSQLLTYLRLSSLRLGLLLNFKVDSLKQGIKRLVL